MLVLSASRIAKGVVALCEANATKPVWHYTPDVRDHLKLARAVLELAARVEKMERVCEAACELHDRADKCIDQPWMGCATDHSRVLSWLSDPVEAYRAALTPTTAEDK